MNQLNGRCFCGAVTYEVANEFEYALNCHCSDCRRATGSAFKPSAGIKAEKLRITTGKEGLATHGDDAGHDAFCSRCSSLLYSVVRENKYVHVTLGTLIDTPSIAPSCHIWVSDKAPWYEIGDSLPQFEEFPF